MIDECIDCRIPHMNVALVVPLVLVHISSFLITRRQHVFGTVIIPSLYCRKRHFRLTLLKTHLSLCCCYGSMTKDWQLTVTFQCNRIVTTSMFLNVVSLPIQLLITSTLFSTYQTNS